MSLSPQHVQALQRAPPTNICYKPWKLGSTTRCNQHLSCGCSTHHAPSTLQISPANSQLQLIPSCSMSWRSPCRTCFFVAMTAAINLSCSHVLEARPGGIVDSLDHRLDLLARPQLVQLVLACAAHVDRQDREAFGGDRDRQQARLRYRNWQQPASRDSCTILPWCYPAAQQPPSHLLPPACAQCPPTAPAPPAGAEAAPPPRPHCQKAPR